MKHPCVQYDSAHADSDGSRSIQGAENMERAERRSARDLDVVSHMELFEGRSDLHKREGGSKGERASEGKPERNRKLSKRAKET